MSEQHRPGRRSGKGVGAATEDFLRAIDLVVVDPVIDGYSDLAMAILEIVNPALKNLQPAVDVANAVSDGLAALALEPKALGAVKEMLEADIAQLKPAHRYRALDPYVLDADKVLIEGFDGRHAAPEYARVSRKIKAEIDVLGDEIDGLKDATEAAGRTADAARAAVDNGVRATRALRELTEMLPNTATNPAVWPWFDMETQINRLLSDRENAARMLKQRIEARIAELEGRKAELKQIRPWFDAGWLYEVLRGLDDTPKPGEGEFEEGLTAIEETEPATIDGFLERAHTLVAGLEAELRRLHAEARDDANDAKRRGVISAILSFAATVIGAARPTPAEPGAPATPPERPPAVEPPPQLKPPPPVTPPPPGPSMPPLTSLLSDTPGEGIITIYYRQYPDGDFIQAVRSVWDPD